MNEPIHSPRRETSMAVERIIARGILRYTTIYGFLTWGVPGFVVTSAIECYRHGFELQVLTFDLFLWCVGAYAIGWLQWQKLKRSRKRSL